MKLNAKQSYFVKQIIPFVIIWMIFGFLYVLIEQGILGRSSIYPATGDKYSFRTNLFYTLPASIIMGFLQGCIELFWLKRILQQRVVWEKLLLKSIFYILLIVLFLSALTLITNIIWPSRSSYAFATLELKRFLSAFAFWSVVIYVGFAVVLTLFISEVNDYLGNTIFSNFLFGKYNEPIEEERIFMFLDLKSSTTIAEEIGHKKYFNFISDYYADMTEAILETNGEIYQYVGDEIVITWPKYKGLFNNNCIRCFYKIQEAIKKRKPYYLKTYDLIPEFKAGLHIGEVTTGEIGILKKEIIHTGDVLNTTARIQSMCNTYNAKILVSEQLKEQLGNLNNLLFKELDTIQLVGKQSQVQLYQLTSEKLA